MSVTSINVISFGYLHGAPPPDATLVLDLRHHFRDPHVDPALRHQTAHDLPVRQAVMGTAGIHAAIVGAALLVDALDAGPSTAPVTIAVGCAGGRHRAATVAMTLADRLRKDGTRVTLTHRDLDKPVVERTTARVTSA
ncbi:RNase adapter RapZ [Kitasatospora sp. NPDC005751]|uniref:RapZ C-terminal domain-containing protein n=1 Tax=Kitasatospora sp. NPDC005751 TaxID=3157064 RepID=UPI0033CAE038